MQCRLRLSRRGLRRLEGQLGQVSVGGGSRSVGIGVERCPDVDEAVGLAAKLRALVQLTELDVGRCSSCFLLVVLQTGGADWLSSRVCGSLLVDDRYTLYLSHWQRGAYLIQVSTYFNSSPTLVREEHIHLTLEANQVIDHRKDHVE